MRITLFYFSGTGNTKAVCDAFKIKMERENARVSIINVEKHGQGNDSQVKDLIRNTDVFGFAYPVFGADLPRIYKDFLIGLQGSQFNNREAFVITTVGYINAYGPFLMKKELKKLGLLLKNHIVLRMPNSTKRITQYDNARSECLVKQDSRITRLVGDILYHRKHISGVGPWVLGGYVVRKVLGKQMKEHYKRWYVDTGLCIDCGQCLGNCPVQAIRSNGGEYSFSDTCITCFRCLHFCPVQAIKMK
ncbi:MAG: EFR1 family ferrodoxin [Spirochaetales bacterium]|nr:EFR1 family ferrodoxin [Spirochaetales bacterium]